MTNVETATPQEQPKHPLMVLREQLTNRLPEFKAVLPPHISPERFARTALSAVQLNPELAACDRRTFFNSLMKAANDGVLVDGRQAVIVAFNDNNPRSPTYRLKVAQYMIMVDGMQMRFRNSGQYKQVDAQVVRDDDPEFKYWINEDGPHLHHVPGDGNGKIIKAYATALLKDGGKAICVMSSADIERRRAISRAKDGPMWREWWDEAAKKTVLRNLHKRLPSSSDDLDRLVERDQELYDFEPAKELPAALGSDHQSSMGVTAALDQFGGRAPAAAEDARPSSGDPASQPQEPTNDQTNQQVAESTDDKKQAAPADAATATKSEEQAQSPAQLARARGAQAKREGVQRRAVPGEYRDSGREAEAEAWRKGWDDPGDPA